MLGPLTIFTQVVNSSFETWILFEQLMSEVLAETVSVKTGSTKLTVMLVLISMSLAALEGRNDLTAGGKVSGMLSSETSLLQEMNTAVNINIVRNIPMKSKDLFVPIIMDD